MFYRDETGDPAAPFCGILKAVKASDKLMSLANATGRQNVGGRADCYW